MLGRRCQLPADQSAGRFDRGGAYPLFPLAAIDDRRDRDHVSDDALGL